MNKKEIQKLAERAFSFVEQNQFDQATQIYQQIIQLDPKHDQSYHLLGFIDSIKSNYNAAAIWVEKAISIYKWCPDYYNTLAGIYRELQRYEDAKEALDTALIVKPDCAETYNNLGMISMDLRDFNQAYLYYEKALLLDPEAAFVHFNYALSLLAGGYYQQGWQEYEWRHKLFGAMPPLLPQQTDIPGNSFTLTHEQGFGDSIQFTRYATWLKKHGAKKVNVICPPQLTRLLETCHGVDTVNNALEDPSITIPMMSMPLLAGNLTTNVPYFNVNTHNVSANCWTFKIGIMWCSSKEDIQSCFVKEKEETAYQLLPSIRSLAYKSAERRRLQLQWFAPLSKLPVCLYNLQKDISAKDCCDFYCPDLIAQDFDFLDTAERLMGLDLIITIDTAVAHLAGALGKPTWLLLPYDFEWRWLASRDDCFWYPTMRIFRQTKRGDWKDVLNAVYNTLANHLVS